MAFGYCFDDDGKFTEMVHLESKFDEVTGEETPLLPPRCTLLCPPDGIYYPVWIGSKWIKTVEVTPEKPEPTPPTEIEVIKGELEKIKQELETIKNKPLEG